MTRFSAQIAFSAEGEGDALSAFRDSLRQAHFSCSHQQIRGGVFYAVTRPQNWYGIIKLAAEHGITLKKTAQKGLRFRLAPYRLRLGLLAGMLCGLALFYWNSAFVRSIEINGNARVSDTEILAALEALGVKTGTPVRDIPYTYIERRMRLAVSDIEWIAIRHAGGRLIVDMTEERNPPQMHSDRIPANIVAEVTAQITDMNVLDGNAVRKPGDAVRAGDLLISGVQEDKFGVLQYCRAAGTVTGIYETDFIKEQPFTDVVTVHGQAKTADVLELFGKRISLSPAFEAPAEPFVYDEQKTPLTVFGLTLPFSRIACSYTPLLTAETVYSPEEAKGILLESAKRYEENFHAEDTLISRNASFLRSDLGIMLKIHYVFEGAIGTTSEIFVKLS